MSVVLFFDLGDTLVIPRLAGDGSLLSLDVLPFVADVLAKLRSTKLNGADLRLGVVSNTGNETMSSMQKVMSKAALLAFFDPALLLFSSVEGFDKTQTQFFDLAASRADVRPKQCVYVGEKRPNAGSRHRPDFAHPIIRSTSFM